MTAIDVRVPVGQKAPAVGEAAPDFTATTTAGASVSLSGLRGQPVWLLFGATWCTECRVEAPDVQAVAVEFSGRVQVMSVYVGEDVATVQGYADRVGLTYPQLADPTQAIAVQYAVMGIPAHYFIDADGAIRKIAVGSLTPQVAREALNGLLG